MNTIEKVNDIKAWLEKEDVPIRNRIPILAQACLEWPYVFGAWGEECSPANRKRRVRDDHPTIKSKCPALNGKTCSSCKWGIGVRMFDCRGFTAWILRAVGLDIHGEGATSQYNTNSNWAVKGSIGSMPEKVCCLFRKKGNSMEHTGLYIGDGVVIHCSNGVESGNLKGWTHFAIPEGIYTDEEIGKLHPTLRKGDKGDEVTILQTKLKERGFDPGTVDGIFGTKTKSAVKKFQLENDLDADGICGPMTWAALETPEEFFDVSIQNVSRKQLNRILELCPTAEFTTTGKERTV